MFPKPLPPSRKVTKERLLRTRELVATARRGVVLRLIIIAAEVTGVVVWGSSALLYDALASSLDVLASLALIWCIALASKPPDRNHPMGHGRFEPIAGLLIGFLLVTLGVFGFIDQVGNLIQGEREEAAIFPYIWVIPFLAVILLELAYQWLKGTAKKTKSLALEADAVHYRVDALGSLFALGALILAAIFPAFSHVFDRAGAALIALMMIGVGIVAGVKNIQQLLDRTPAPEYFDQVREAAMKVKGVLATEKIRLQVYGPDAHVAIDIEVDPQLSVLAAHRLTQEVRREIQNAWPSVRDVIVHVEPYYPGDH